MTSEELEQEVARLLEALATSERERSSERTGRIRAEQALRAARATVRVSCPDLSALLLADARVVGGGDSMRRRVRGPGRVPAGAYWPPAVLLQPEERHTSPGTLRAATSVSRARDSYHRHPRGARQQQPLLVQQARSRLQLAAHVSPASLDGLAEFSHCWVLYVFHANTDLDTRLGAQSTTRVAPGKVHVPRLNGAKRGVLATRSPHRPCPLGLSVGRVLAVDGRSITFGGLDVVDGTPVLDVKPYLPFCDAVLQATAPHWAQAQVPDGEEPLAVESVGFAPGAQEAVTAAWEASRQGGRGSLFDTADAFLALVEEALGRDIRSAHQRQRPAAPGGGAPQVSSDEQEGRGHWRVVLEGVNVGYSLDDATGRSVTITDAYVQAS